MININCKRDKDGLYELDDLDKTDHVIKTGRVSESKQGANFWLQRNYGASFLVKYREYPSYIFALYAELLYSGICKRNNVRCANIDVGKYKGNYCVLSEDVTIGADEKFDSYGLAYISGKSQDDVYGEDKNIFRKDFFANQLYSFAEKIQNDFKHVEIDENFLNDLYKLAVLDLMMCQRDRNPTNIMFTLGKKDENGKRTLKVAPIFDNEFCFGFMRLSAFYNHYHLDPIAYAKETEGGFSLSNLFLDASYDATCFETPIFGTKNEIERFRFPLCLDVEDSKFKNDRKKATEILKKEYDNIANIAVNNKEIGSFIENFDEDVFEVANQIKKSSGFEIPEAYLENCSMIISRNLRCLKKRIAKIKQAKENDEIGNEKGE